MRSFLPWINQRTLTLSQETRFPPRKLHPPEDYHTQTAHSPLSPLTTSSPLFPDGLIAPIWIRKHTTLVPSVFVLFLSLFEFPPHTPRSPLDAPDPDRERQREQEERRRDMELAAEIAQRKKTTNERGIKLTVVLLASRHMLGTSLIHYPVISVLNCKQMIQLWTRVSPISGGKAGLILGLPYLY